MGAVDDETLLHMLAFAVRQRKRDLAELSKKHPLDDKAGERVAKAILDHIRLCGCDIAQVKPHRQTIPPSAKRNPDASGD